MDRCKPCPPSFQRVNLKNHPIPPAFTKKCNTWPVFPRDLTFRLRLIANGEAPL